MLTHSTTTSPPGKWPPYGIETVGTTQRVYITESEKAAAAARSIGLVSLASTNGSATAHRNDWSPLAGRECVLLPSNDQAGQEYCETIRSILAGLRPPPSVRVVRLPNLPEGGDIVDWLDQHDAVEAEQLRETIDKLADERPWPEIESLEADALPAFPLDSLPEVLRVWVAAEAVATQTPAELPALLALATCSAILARRVEVEPQPGWREPVNLFVAVLLEPGNRKSAVFQDATKPLRDIEADLVEQQRTDVAREQSKRRQAQKRLELLERKAVTKNDANAQSEALNLAAQLADWPEPTLSRFIVDDATSEKLAMMLDDQDGRIASMSPEGGVFDLMGGKYSKSGMPQFDVYLKGHSGDDLIVDRVSRKSIRVPHPALTCAYTVQPAVISGLADKAAFRGRGLLARFLYAAPASTIGSRKIDTEPVSPDVSAEYDSLCRSLAEPSAEAATLGLDGPAHEVFRDWQFKVEVMLADGGDMEAIRDWGAKLAGQTLRLAAVLHCAGGQTETHIGKDTIEAAAKIGRYLIPHAELVLSMLAANHNSSVSDARYILAWIRRNRREQFTKRDIQQSTRRRFQSADEIDEPLRELTERGYIRRTTIESPKRGRPPSPTYETNAEVLDS